MIEHNGKIYTRVSEILKPFVNFSDIPEDVLKRKCAIGTSVHDIIHQCIEGNNPILTLEEQGYVESFNKWRAALAPTFVESEVRYYNDSKMLTGAIDALIKIEGEKKAILVDFKTSAQESPTVWCMQGHLYHFLITESGKSISNRFLFLKLDKAGELPKVFEYKFDRNVMAKCLQAIDDYWNDED